MKIALATFAAGCFWGIEETFRTTPGVLETRVGYSGGHVKNPAYREVCDDTTGHAEAVEIQFDPEKISYEKLLEIFFSIHNPTLKNRQGPDIGSQYRSAIFYHNEDQKKSAEKAMQAVNESGKYQNPVATELSAAMPFYPAEEYHQKYLMKKGATSCHI